MNRTEFLTYFLWQRQEDMTELPPAPQAVEQAMAMVTDRIGFEAYLPQFEAFAQIMKNGAAEGMWGGDLKRNPGITELATLPADERAKYVVVAVQVLSWLDECNGLVQDWAPRCAI